MTIEDCLEILLGFHPQYANNIPVKKEDAGILLSVAKQIGKGTALTDRQLEMLKTKLVVYKESFDNLDIDINDCFDRLRYPLRQIDRSKYIKIDDTGDIAIRFPFTKKLIVLIEEIARAVGSHNHYHKKGSHLHTFKLTEQSVYHIMKRFKNKDFEIDESLLAINKDIEKIVENPYDYIPGIYNYEIRNCHPIAKQYILDTLGNPEPNNMYLFKDRAHVLGLKYFDDDAVTTAINKCTPLTQKIINRKKSSVFLSRNSYSISSIIESLIELDRFPIVVVVDQYRHNDLDCIDNFYTIHKAFTNIIDNKDVSVLFRLDNESNDNIEFNKYIKNNNLNNVVDKNTKVVYIKDKIPKFLIKDNWNPGACISCCSNVRLISRKNNYVGDVDLTIHWEKDLSAMGEYYNRNSFVEGIEKL